VAQGWNTEDWVSPWAHHVADDRRFMHLLLPALAAYVVAGIWVSELSLPEKLIPSRALEPPALIDVLLEPKSLPEPKQEEPPPVLKAEPEPVPANKVPVEAVVPRESHPTASREAAEVDELLSFADDLADMRDAIAVGDLERSSRSLRNADAAQVERSRLGASGSAGGMAGIETSKLRYSSGAVSTQAVERRETTRVASNISADESSTRHSDTGRSEESIRKTMDRNKGAVFAVYNRALRKNPGLRGTLTVQMIIEPSGDVASVKVLSSELSDPNLDSKLLTRIRMIAFGAEDVIRTTLNYSFNFMPFR
jgi:protein TonB